MRFHLLIGAPVAHERDSAPAPEDNRSDAHSNSGRTADRDQGTLPDTTAASEPPESPARAPWEPGQGDRPDTDRPCLLYTSDAADERSSVDLGGRRIIKKKNKRR